MSSKEIVVYAKDSYFKYHNLFVDYLYEVNEKNHLLIYERDRETGDEATIAYFKTWDYYLINENSE